MDTSMEKDKKDRVRYEEKGGKEAEKREKEVEKVQQTREARILGVDIELKRRFWL